MLFAPDEPDINRVLKNKGPADDRGIDWEWTGVECNASRWMEEGDCLCKGFFVFVMKRYALKFRTDAIQERCLIGIPVYGFSVNILNPDRILVCKRMCLMHEDIDAAVKQETR